MSNVLLNFIKILVVVAHLNSAVYSEIHDPRVPETNFRCQDQEFPGYFADTETECQVFHICVHRLTRYDQYSFLCPNGTAFHQELLVCDWRHRVDCKLSTSFYHINRLIYQEHGDSDEVFTLSSEVPRQGRRQSKALPDNFIHDVPVTSIEASIPEESRRPLEILSGANNKRLRDKTGRNSGASVSQNVGNPLDIPNREHTKSKVANKVVPSKVKNIKQKSSFSKKKVPNQRATSDRRSPYNENISNKKIDSKKSTSSPSAAKTNSIRTLNLPNSQRSSTNLSGKTSFGSKAAAGRRTTVSGTLSKNKKFKPAKKDSLSNRNKSKSNNEQSSKNTYSPLKNANNSKLGDKKNNVQLNVPSSVPSGVGLFLKNITPNRQAETSRTQSGFKKAPILIISSAEAETNEQNQKRVYLNRIKSTNENTATEEFGGKPLKIGRKEKKTRVSSQKKVLPQLSRRVSSSSKTSKTNLRRGRPTKSSRPHKRPTSSRFKTPRRRQQPSPSVQRTTFRDESLEEGKLGLIASSILKLRPRFF